MNNQSSAVSAPAQVVDLDWSAQRNVSSNVFRNCQAIKSAVVTVYAGKEIGSGSIISPEGLVITNYHVVRDVMGDRGGGWLSVQTIDQANYSGKVIGIDWQSDLALIQLSSRQRFPTVRLAGNRGVQIGQHVWAIGSPFGCPGVLTEGILEIIKPNGDLQSNVVLNPGNSGGPLLNSQGEMIGINKAILQSSSGRNSGVSFATNIQAVQSFIGRVRPGAIAVSTTKRTAPASTPSINVFQLENFNCFSTSSTKAVSITSNCLIEQKSSSPKDFLGLIVDSRNLIVRQVRSGSLAAMSGFKQGDRLISMNGVLLRRLEQLQDFLNQQPESATFVVNRDQQLATLQVNF